MLISPERVFYAGLLGRPRGRTTGSFMIYVSIEGGMKLTQDGHCSEGLTIAMVRPDVAHTVESDYRSIINVTIEPETITPAALDGSARQVTEQGPVLVERIRAAYQQWKREKRRDGFTTEEFDGIVLGEVLPRRQLDPRIVDAIARLAVFSGPAVTAAGLRRSHQSVAVAFPASVQAGDGRSRFVPTGPTSERGICCISSMTISISPIWPRTSAIRIPPISAIRSVASMG